MPIVTINMVAGRDRARIQDCLRQVAETVSRTLDAPLPSVRVLANEVHPELWTVGTTLKSEEHPTDAAPCTPHGQGMPAAAPPP